VSPSLETRLTLVAKHVATLEDNLLHLEQAHGKGLRTVAEAVKALLGRVRGLEDQGVAR
jgi:hypothetical protein